MEHINESYGYTITENMFDQPFTNHSYDVTLNLIH
jgi:hypothetical protein